MYVYINVHSMYTRSTMILDNASVIFQCMKLLHVSFRISKIIKLSKKIIQVQIHKNVARIFYVIGRFAHAYFVVIQQKRK